MLQPGHVQSWPSTATCVRGADSFPHLPFWRSGFQFNREDVLVTCVCLCVCGALHVSEEFELFDPGGEEGTEVDSKQQEVYRGVCAK